MAWEQEAGAATKDEEGRQILLGQDPMTPSSYQVQPQHHGETDSLLSITPSHHPPSTNLLTVPPMNTGAFGRTPRYEL